jgi:hypothetical protein
VNGGDSNKFSLCNSTSGEVVVIYNAEEANSTEAGYEWSTCNAVDIYMLLEDE